MCFDSQKASGSVPTKVNAVSVEYFVRYLNPVLPLGSISAYHGNSILSLCKKVVSFLWNTLWHTSWTILMSLLALKETQSSQSSVPCTDDPGPWRWVGFASGLRVLGTHKWGISYDFLAQAPLWKSASCHFIPDLICSYFHARLPL